MSRLSLCGQTAEIDLVVFDKDGCLFESKAFWNGLAESRARRLAEETGPETALAWLSLVGVTAHTDAEGRICCTDCDPMGALAVAPPSEEILLCATVLLSRCGGRWPRCRETAERVFEEADARLDLDRCIRPRKGFPAVFERLAAAGIPFGIATSDDRGRALASVGRYFDPAGLAFLFTPEDVVRNKPDRETLDRIAARFGIADMRRILMVCESYVDMLMARNAGAVGFGVPA